jgi:hypothetical protein
MSPAELQEGAGAAQPTGGRVRRWLLAACAVWLLAGCAAWHVREAIPLYTGSLQEIAPFHDGDHYVYRATRAGEDWAVQVEHVKALDKPGEFLINLTENGSLIAQMHVRESATAASIVSVVYPEQDAGFLFTQPLPVVEVPLRREVLRSDSTVTVWRLSDGKTLDRGDAYQTVTSEPATAERADVSPAEFELQTERTLHFRAGALHSHATAWVARGIGEVRSDDVVQGVPALHRELVCAIVGGRRIGDCGALLSPKKEM